MAPQVFFFLATGFEEVEALLPIDILRRCGVDARLISIGSSLQVAGAHGVRVLCNGLLSATDFSQASAMVLPGGMPGAKYLAESDPLGVLLKESAEKGIGLCAICAAPMVLGRHGLLNGKRATCYPGFESYLQGATTCSDLVVCDGNVITAKGPGAAAEFGFAIAKSLCPSELVDEVRAQMFF